MKDQGLDISRGRDRDCKERGGDKRGGERGGDKRSGETKRRQGTKRTREMSTLH